MSSPPERPAVYHPDGDERIRRNEAALRIVGREGLAYRSPVATAKDFRILPLARLLSLDRIRKRQDMTDAAWMDPTDNPLLTIFVSHRWESPEHPDPDGSQLDVLKTFGAMFLDVAVAHRLPPDQRRRLVPSLLEYGALQAAYFVGEIAGFLDGFSGSDSDLRSELLRRIGIWYDFVALPQKERTVEEEAELALALQKLQRFAASAPVLVLRQADDDYAQRSWCELEFWAAGHLAGDHTFTAPVLRRDLFGTRLNLEHLAPPSNFTSREDFYRVCAAVAAWEGDRGVKAGDVALRIRKNYFLAFSWKEKNVNTPVLTRPDFRAHNEACISRTPPSFQFWYAVREHLCLNGLHDEDFAGILREQMEAKAIRCTESRDVIPTCLWLLGSHDLLFDFGFMVFYGRCLLRHMVEGKDLRVQLFKRYPSQLVHFRFRDGEEALEG